MPMTARYWAAAAALLLGAAVPACRADDDASEHESSVLSEGCAVNSDCASPLVCAFQRCHAQCITTRDCDGTLRCVGAKRAARTCQLEDEVACQTSADCAPGLWCAADASCRDACQNDAECIGEQVCVKGACAEPSELDDSGELPQVSSLRACRLPSDCEDGETCVAGACLPQCRQDRDCAPGESCRDGACEPPPDEAACACHADVDCSAGQRCSACACVEIDVACRDSSQCEAGKQCVDGQCLCGCVEDRDCPSSQQCDGCSCVARSSVTSVHDAKLKGPLDIVRMRGITRVETTLTLSGSGLKSSLGLEALESVGRLEIISVGLTDPDALAGLGNLTQIDGDLVLEQLAFTDLSFNPKLGRLRRVLYRWRVPGAASVGGFGRERRAASSCRRDRKRRSRQGSRSTIVRFLPW
jgi:hypothetical protein